MKEHLHFYDKAMTTPLLDKFLSSNNLSSIIDPTKIVGNDFFAKTLDFNLLMKTLREHIKRRIMGSVFTILNVEEPRNTATRNHQVVKQDDLTVNLLEDYSTLDLNTVMSSTEHYVMHFNTKIDAENLAWSQELIMNSCDDKMKHYLQS
jgi:hypothetical protein